MPEEINCISDESEQYPPLLREIADAPTELYIRGDAALLSRPLLLAVVGSRKASPYGLQALQKVVQPVVQAGIPLVSGLAFGIDSMAHKLCLNYNVPTIAVLGGGIDDASLYPRHHISLAHRIVAGGGAIISEYPPTTAALPHHFLARNRIIAGLCSATLVVQAAQRSGSLTTARLALDANRDVMAIPGNITDPLAQGVNRLIQQGATPIITGDDLINYFGIQPENTAIMPNNLSPQQILITTYIGETPLHIDELIAKSGLPASDVGIELTQLELQGIIINVGGMKYALSHGS